MGKLLSNLPSLLSGFFPYFSFSTIFLFLRLFYYVSRVSLFFVVTFIAKKSNLETKFLFLFCKFICL